MNGALRAAIRGSQSHCSHLRNALFHSTPVLERKRRTSWESKANVHNKRYRRRREKQALLHNVSAFADHLFGSWHDEFDTNDQSSSRHSSWFKKQYCKGSGRNRSSKCGPQSWGRFEFCEDDDELEIDYIFRSAFGRSRGFFWSFTHEEEEPRQRFSSRYTNYFRRSWNSRYHKDDDDDDGDEDEYEEYNDSGSSQASHRLALGLSPSGPLNLVDVKNAYRACALKWHPDRHQGSSKAVAEEKFKLCSVAYQSLCEKLAVS